MYKVFFDNRTIYFIDQFDGYYKQYNGLFIRYLNEIQLAYVLELFRNVQEIRNVFIAYHDVDKAFQDFQSFFRLLEAAGGLVFNEKGQVLVIKRRGKWDLPKGKKEDGEEPEICALREVKEECGIHSLEIDDLLHTTYHSYTLDGVLILKRTYWYKMKGREEESLIPQAKEEITEAKWMNPEDLDVVTENTFLSIIDVLKAGKLL
ncbi:MAG: NUDIX hydrolase [Bacteroidales bacterium]|nr:NUDIX hydrolase [Bacteroidales bacterium]